MTIICPLFLTYILHTKHLPRAKLQLSMDSAFVALVQGCITLLIVIVLLDISQKTIWRPYVQMRELKKQGLKSPPFKRFKGNLQDMSEMFEEALTTHVPTECPHDIVFKVLPHIHRWSQTYGETFFYWSGSIPRINISDPELAKQILSDKFGHFPKPPPTVQIKHLLGQGLSTVKDGHKWAQHRRILTPAFHLEVLKSMVPLFQECAKTMLERWEMSESKETEVMEEFRCLTADVIAKAAFGSSYEEGKLVFDLQTELGYLVSKAFRKYYFPGSRFWPTKENLRTWKMDRDIKQSLRKLISNRLKSHKESSLKDGNGRDLLDMMIESNKMSKGKLPALTMQEMIDECKTFYFAGHETTSTLLTWTVVVLCMHTDWQERARQDVLHHCAQDPPAPDSLSRLKTVNMILHEVLRLYPPATAIVRRADKDVEISSEKRVLKVPAHAEVLVPITMVHHDKRIWGSDANEFNPERFQDGVSKAANHPMAFMPFGIGPRVCIGMNFALIEARIVLSMILQRFRFEFSKGYVHSPRASITIRPQHGAHVIFHPLK